MNIVLPHFDGSSIPELQDNEPQGSGNQWGWIGAVNRENDASCEAFVTALMNGDIESARKFQEFGRNFIFAVARVSADEVTVALFEKVAEPVAPALLGNWTFKNEGVRIDSTEARQLEKLLQTTRLSWKESFFAILRSLK